MIISDRDEAESVAGRLDDVTVLHGDGTDHTLLREEHVGDTDAFLGLSDHDEVNLMACQLARSEGCPRTIALVHKPDYVSIYEQLGVNVAVSPRLLCANAILAHVRGGSVTRIESIEEGQAEILEIEIPAGSKMVGRRLRQSGLPKGAVIGAIARESGEIVVPSGEDTIEAMDSLVVFALQAVVAQVVEAVR